MARIRPIQSGYVYQKGPSWFVQWREDVRDGAGNITREKFKAKLCPVKLAGRTITRREAERLAWVFHNNAGRPIDYHNLSRRVLKPIAKQVLGHTAVSWHTFRHCAATFCDWVEMPVAERVAMMGHSRATMTLHYTHADIERRRPYLDQIETLLTAKPKAEENNPFENATLQ